MPAVLAIDTSTDACSVAFAHGAHCRASHRLLPRAHNRHILAMIDDVLAGRSLGDVDIFSCGVGPGSFTGLRIAASVVQGLAWSVDKPVLAFCSLQAQACSALNQGVVGEWILSATDAQIGQLYWRLFRVVDGQPLAVTEPAICRPSELVLPSGAEAVVAVGSGANLQSEFEPKVLTRIIDWHVEARPHASDMAKIIASESSIGSLVAPHELSPRYVQQDIGWKKLSEQPRRD